MIDSGVLRNAKVYEKRPWGTFRVLSAQRILCINKPEGPVHQIIKTIIVHPKQQLSYQRHNLRSEEWHIVSGTGIVTINDKENRVRPGDTVLIPVKTKHRIRNPSKTHNLIFTEISGGLFDEYDIERISDDYGRDSEWKNK